MTICVTIICDAAEGEGLCPTRTPGWPDVDMARAGADRDGWLVRRNGSALCPRHAGYRPPRPPRRPQLLRRPPQDRDSLRGTLPPDEAAAFVRAAEEM